MRLSASKTFFLTIYFYFAIFGPRVLGIVDLSVIINIVAMFIMCSTVIVFPKRTMNLLEVLIGLLIYSSIICVITNTFDYLFLLKFVRVMVASLAISSVIGSKRYNCENVINALINVLLLHAIIIIIESLFFPELQILLAPFSGYERDVYYSFRGTGLTNGYDFAGLLCNIGLLLCLTVHKRKGNIIRILIFCISVLLTSRFNMLLLGCILLYFVIKKESISFWVKLVFIATFCIAVIPAIGVFLYTTGNENQWLVKYLLNNNSFFNKIVPKLYHSYARTDISSTILNHYDFSMLSGLEILLGSMKDAHQDPGYTQYIYKIGLIGLSAVIGFYVVLLKSIHFKNKYTFSVFFYNNCHVCLFDKKLIFAR